MKRRRTHYSEGAVAERFSRAATAAREHDWECVWGPVLDVIRIRGIEYPVQIADDDNTVCRRCGQTRSQSGSDRGCPVESNSNA
jgi:hypothetical protein